MDATPFLPAGASLAQLRSAAADCRGCPLFEPATQTVFGEGDPGAQIVIVGETPGDQEDRAGRPFVGPAGRELDRALEAAGLRREELYVTNAVKHFKFEERGKRRIHEKPTRSEVKACGPWLTAEIDEVAPRALLAMGATATTQLLGSRVKVTKDRGRPLDSPLAEIVMVTIHPSAILRALRRGPLRAARGVHRRHRRFRRRGAIVRRMFLGLRTVIYPAPDLEAAKAWFAQLTGVEPYFDEPFYVGFTLGGYELGLDPDAPAHDGPVTYWGVADCDAGLQALLDAGATQRTPVTPVGDGIRVASALNPFGAIVGVIENPHFAPTTP